MPTSKKVSFSARPAGPLSVDQWVGERKAAAAATRRLTLDIQASLHARIKSACALRGVKMVEEITALLEAKYGTDAPNLES
jgi:hypothetical protein